MLAEKTNYVLVFFCSYMKTEKFHIHAVEEILIKSRFCDTIYDIMLIEL